jgi:hypothetical protein
MNIIYDFVDLKVEVAPTLEGNQNVITRIRYTYCAEDTDSNASAEYVGFHDFELTPGSSFVPFEQVTKNVAKSWLESNVDTTDIELFLSKEIEDKITPKFVSVKAPWETEETAVETILDDSFPPAVQPTVIPEP